eukprot:7379808-Prymnesium_polylepis.4
MPSEVPIALIVALGLLVALGLAVVEELNRTHLSFPLLELLSEVGDRLDEKEPVQHQTILAQLAGLEEGERDRGDENKCEHDAELGHRDGHEVIGAKSHTIAVARAESWSDWSRRDKALRRSSESLRQLFS